MKNGTAVVWEVPSAAGLYRTKAEEVDAGKLEALWSDLTGSDALAAHQTTWAMVDAPARAVPFLRGRLRPAAAVDPGQVRRLVTDLDSDQFAVRAAAAKELELLGEQAAPALREALAATPSPEVRKQAEGLVAGMRLVRSPDQLR